jgi:hypothetical protein
MAKCMSIKVDLNKLTVTGTSAIQSITTNQLSFARRFAVRFENVDSRDRISHFVVGIGNLNQLSSLKTEFREEVSVTK